MSELDLDRIAEVVNNGSDDEFDAMLTGWRVKAAVTRRAAARIETLSARVAELEAENAEVERLRAELERTRQAWVDGDDPLCDDVCVVACKGPCNVDGTDR